MAAEGSAVRIVDGTGSGPTATASYDAALATAGVHNYNLVTVSSVLPADATVVEADAAPDLGPAGSRLTVVQARATVAGPGAACAGLGWSREPGGPGILYEVGETAGAGEGVGDGGTDLTDPAADVEAGAGGDTGDGTGPTDGGPEHTGDPGPATAELRDAVASQVRSGLAAGRTLRDWDFGGEQVETVTTTAGREEFATAVLLAIYGEGEPVCRE